MVSFFKKLGKVIAVRRRKNDPVITCHDSGDPVPVATPGVLSSPALPSDSLAGHSVSARIEQRVQISTPGACDVAQLVLSGVNGIVAPIPLVGSPLQAAISGLLTILQTIDVSTHLTTRTVPNLDNLQTHTQSKAAIAGLRGRLNRLSGHLCNAPIARDGFEQLRRENLIRYTTFVLLIYPALSRTPVYCK